MKFTRRHILKTGAAIFAALGFPRFAKPAFAAAPAVTGEILGASAAVGHKLWHMGFAEPAEAVEKDVVIVGGGIAGLGAAYRLHKAGVTDFTLLELEKDPGGNAVSGKNDVSAYPWGAHYVPVLTEESRAVVKLFEELKIITGRDKQGVPKYDEFYTCTDPHERLFMFDRWQETLLPQVGATEEDRAQYDRFFDFMEDLKGKRGRDGKKLFAIPIDESSQDAEWLELDRISMKEWMEAGGYTSKYLQWHVNYSCRDDYGTTFEESSAWAGIHYFAARDGKAANTDGQNFVTWPEGNGFIVERLAKPVKKNISCNSLVYAVKKDEGGVTVDYLDLAAKTTKRIRAKACVMACPQFVASRLMPEDGKPAGFSYAPWAVANITLDKLPEGKGADIAWDNVAYDSKLLGYVVATHQKTEMRPLKTVLTYYWPLDHLPPDAARKEALSRTYEQWRDIFLDELLALHPELKGLVKRLDVWLWGHAMVRPVPGFIWSDERRHYLKQTPPVFRAHSDMSGISIFEEAYTHGVRAGEGVLSHLGVKHETEL